MPTLRDSQLMTRVRDDLLLQAFAHVLRQLRRDVGLSQEQLALKAGVDRTFVGKLESAKHQPSLAVVFQLSGALGIPPPELLGMVIAQVEATSKKSLNEG